MLLTINSFVVDVTEELIRSVNSPEFFRLRDSVIEWGNTNTAPMSDETFLEWIKLKNILGLQLGVHEKWWENWDNNGPIPFPKVFKRDKWGPEGTMAHVAVELGIFPSLTQARKNGFDKPLTLGEHEFKKKRLRFVIVE